MLLEMLFSLVFGWNLVTVTQPVHPQEFVAQHECIDVLAWYDRGEWRLWFTDQSIVDSDFFVTLPPDYEEEHGRGAWSIYWLEPANGYWVYCG